MHNTIYIVQKPEETPYSKMVTESVINSARRANLGVIQTANGIHDDTLIVAIGGDGTMLQAMRFAAWHDATALGINLGRVGFLTDITPKKFSAREEFADHIAGIFSGEIPTHIEERTLLSFQGPSTRFDLAGNEVSVSRIRSDSMIEYTLKIDQYSAGAHRANSILVSTASGSTAYAMSAGGALMMPAMHSMQVVPVAAWTMTSRPILVSGRSEIRIEAWGEGIAVRADGRIVTEKEFPFTKEYPFILNVKTFEKPAKILHPADWNYFDMLSEKMGWIKG